MGKSCEIGVARDSWGRPPARASEKLAGAQANWLVGFSECCFELRGAASSLFSAGKRLYVGAINAGTMRWGWRDKVIASRGRSVPRG